MKDESIETTVKVIIGDYGYSFFFTFYKEDKVTPFDLDDYDVYFSTSLGDTEMGIVGDPENGQCSYDLEKDKFNTVKKLYEARIYIQKGDSEKRTIFRFYILTV